MCLIVCKKKWDVLFYFSWGVKLNNILFMILILMVIKYWIMFIVLMIILYISSKCEVYLYLCFGIIVMKELFRSVLFVVNKCLFNVILKCIFGKKVIIWKYLVEELNLVYI